MEKLKAKHVRRAAEAGLTQAPSESNAPAKYTTEDLHQSQIMRFDYIVRKVMKICGNDSTENFNEQTVEQVWFLTLDSMIKIKQEQLKMLHNMRPRKDEPFKNRLAEHPESMASGLKTRYDTYIDNVEEFFKSRIDYVIENILQYIELNEFLDHIVEKNDKDIKYSELSVLIQSIFTETSNEHVVVGYAYNSAKK